MNKLQSGIAIASSTLALGGTPDAVAQQVSTTLGAGSPAAATVTRTPLPQPYPIPDKAETKNFAGNTILTYTISLDDQVANLQPGEQKNFNIAASPEGIPANSTCTAESLVKTVTYQKAQLAQAIQVPTLSSFGLGVLALLMGVLAYRRKKVDMPVILAAVAAAGMTLPPDTIAAIADPNTIYGSVSAGLKSMNVVLEGMRLTITVEANGNCTIEIPPANTAPTANADTATVDAGSSVDISVLANDTDPDGNTLSIGTFTQPAHGNVTKVGNILRYTPTAGYSGPDTFTYYAYDGTTNSLTPATVTINVLAPANVAPTPTFTGFSTDASLSMNVSGQLTATDPNNDPLTYAITTQPTIGTITLGANGNFTYTGSVLPGSYTFVYTVSDGKSTPVAKTATIIVNDVAPVAPAGSAFANLTNMTVSDNGGVVPITPINADGVTDPLGRTITYSATGLPNTAVGVGVGSLSLNTATGAITGTYDAIVTSPFSITVTATNGGKSISKTFTLTMRNDG